MAKNDKFQYSLRMNKELYEEIRLMSKLTRSTMSSFMLTAIRMHAIRKRRKLQRSLTESLKILDEYAKRDPEYTEAIEKIADAEVSSAVNPIEGVFYDVREDEDKEPHAVNSSALEEFLENA
jgi:hypothetical protein